VSEKRLLVVDDEPEFGEFVRRVASGLGYEVRVTTHGRAFQEAYHELHPTTIVMDMVMPEMDGNELVLWLMEQGYAAHLIIITGYSPDYAHDARVLAEFNGLRSVRTLTKPIGLLRLREVLSEGETARSA
jgi:CheY-like chemotaxis protein